MEYCYFLVNDCVHEISIMCNTKISIQLSITVRQFKSYFYNQSSINNFKIHDLNLFPHMKYLVANRYCTSVSLFTNLIALDVSNSMLITYIDTLTNLRDLYLSTNEFIEDINNLINLTKLFLCSSSYVTNITNLTKLRDLILHKSVNTISGLVNLESLKVGYCEPTLGNFSKLTLLHMKYCQLDNIQHFVNLLDFSLENQSKSLNITTFSKLTNLEIYDYTYETPVSLRFGNIDCVYFTNLISMSISNNDIFNLDKLLQLQSLILCNVYASKLYKLTKLNILSLINISSNKLRKLTSLYYLLLINSYTSDIQDLINLNTLHIEEKIESKKSLKLNLRKLTQLTSLIFKANSVFPQNLSSLINLKSLHLLNTYKIFGLKILTNLVYLEIKDVKDLDCISSLINLTGLRIINGKIKNISMCTNLYYLNLINQSKINNIYTLTKLTYLCLWNASKIYKLENLINLKNLFLNQISLKHNKLYLPNLTELILKSDTGIRDISMMTGLINLSICNSEIHSVQNLYNLQNLELYYEENREEYVTNLTKLTRLCIGSKCRVFGISNLRQLEILDLQNDEDITHYENDLILLKDLTVTFERVY